jgi:hypothetical protein
MNYAKTWNDIELTYGMKTNAAQRKGRKEGLKRAF